MSEPHDVVRSMHTGIGRALGCSLVDLDAAGLLELARDVERLRRRLSAVDTAIIGEMEARHVAGEYARCSTADLLVTELRLAPDEAKARVATAGDLGRRRSLVGEQLPPLLPAVADAVCRGEVSSAHVSVIRACVDDVPSAFDAEAVSIREKTLIDAARHEHPGSLRRTAALLLARLDPDGEEPREREVQRKRGMSLSRSRDGMGRLTARLTLEATAALSTVLDSLSAPVPSADGEPDPRTPPQRGHDALLDACHRLLRSGSLPPAGGVPVTLLALTTLDELRAGSGTAVSAHGDVLRLADLLAGVASDAEVVPVVLGDVQDLDMQRADVQGTYSDFPAGGKVAVPHGTDADPRGEAADPRGTDTDPRGEVADPHGRDDPLEHCRHVRRRPSAGPGAVLAVGRRFRLATRLHWLALAARDGGCCFPGCDRPPAWTEVHHVVPWVAGGRTDVDNMCLLCRFHHREFERRGWSVRMTHGVPEWIPPPFIDRDRRPRRHCPRHPPERRLRGTSAGTPPSGSSGTAVDRARLRGTPRRGSSDRAPTSNSRQ